ncbi:uncharacterized protein LOC116922800 isoform X2 [Daphnia magna]|nr:uncharacterized protein LOC116922800 isoform X2 [Daphnia magna]
MLCILPSILTQCISLRWHQVDQTAISLPMAFSHVLLLGIVHRYAAILNLGVRKSQKKVFQANNQQALQLLCHYQSDVCLLRLFESFLESAPQLLLQLYVMYELDSWHPWTGISAMGSLLSLAWGIASYARTMRNSREDKERITWVGLALQAAWRTGTMVSRVIALLLCASVLHLWFLLVIAIHWVGMTVWTIKQKTDLCSTAWEERIYNAIVGVIYCFCFFNIKEGHSRQRAVVFYTVTATENAACLAMFLRFSHTHQDRPWFDIAAPTLIIIGSILGHTSQLVYYRWFHPSGPIQFRASSPASVEEIVCQAGVILGEQPIPSFSPVFMIRTLKHMNRKFSGVSLASALIEPVAVGTIKVESSGVPLENNNPHQGMLPYAGKTEVVAEVEHPKHLGASRSGGVKSLSDSRLLEITNIPFEARILKTKSDGELHMVNFLHPGKMVQTGLLCDEADSKSESSCASVHDYENMVFVNVNRTDWGIRHWKSYSDIETSCHDNSVCKEREPLESSINSASSNDSTRVLPFVKLSMEEAIAQLKSLATHGHNVYQRPEENTATKLYEVIWLNETETTGSIVNPVRLCPTNGHNLSIITELSESNSTASNGSKSSLVQTVDTIINKSADDSSVEDEHLTYVEINFLSKLSEPSMETELNNELHESPKKRLARRHFSIIRDKFEDKSNQLVKKPNTNLIKINKENISMVNCTFKIHDSTSPIRQPVLTPKKQSTLSPESRIFSQSSLKC